MGFVEGSSLEMPIPEVLSPMLAEPAEPHIALMYRRSYPCGQTLGVIDKAKAQ